MKKTILITLLLLIFISKGSAQEKEKNLAKEDLKEVIESIFNNSIQTQVQFSKYQKKEQKDAIKTNTIKNIKTLINKLKSKANLSPEVSFSLDNKIEDLESAKPEDVSKIVDEIASKINELIQLTEKEFLGTFKLINKGEKIEIYNKETDKKETEDFKSVAIEIKDGDIYDIKAIVDDSSFYYNKRPANIFSFNKRENTIKLHSNLNNDKKEKTLELADLIGFNFENGKRYVVEQDLIHLTPTATTHKVEINNNLKSIIDFRIYSDFLGLIEEAPNGIVSFEGSSTFYLNPFSVFKSYSYLFKKLKTRVRYSRLDEEDKTVSPILNDKLDLLQKSFLNFGGELDLYEIRFRKKFPYKLVTKAKGAIDITEISDGESEADKFNTTTLGLGVGAEIQVERYHNFGLHTSFYFNRYQNNNISENNILNFNTFSINSEVYFYTPGSKNDAIFIRAQYEQGMRDLTPSSNFFTIQFGYKAELNFKSKKEK